MGICVFSILTPRKEVIHFEICFIKLSPQCIALLFLIVLDLEISRLNWLEMGLFFIFEIQCWFSGTQV